MSQPIPSDPCQQPSDLTLRLPQEPSSLNDQEGRDHQLIGDRAGGGEIVSEQELTGGALDSAIRDEFFRLLNRRGDVHGT